MRLRLAGPVMLSLAMAARAQDPPRFESRVETVHLDVSVRRGGSAVQGLTAADFEVLDEGVPQAVELVATDDVGIHALIALDVSGSVAGTKLDALKAAARGFLERLGERDRATLLTFSHRLKLETGVAVPPAEARAALERTEAAGGTALFDALASALVVADRRHGRPVILAFSDGEDDLSFTTAERLRTLARESDVLVHAVAVTSRPAATAGTAGATLLDSRGEAARRAEGQTGHKLEFEAWARGTVRDRRPVALPEALREVTQETGGDTWRADHPDDLAQVFLNVLDEVRGRYLLRYEPRGVPRQGWHRLKVRVKGRGGDVRARRGYRPPP